MKKILALHTGGTISMTVDRLGNVAPTASNPMNDLPVKFDNLEILSEEFLHLPSPQITLEHMLSLKNRIKRAFLTENIDAVVVTHGTDTLEETAFFLDLTLPQGKPVVLTGAMRSIDEVGTDGIHNFLTAIRVASDDASWNRGVLVAMNDEIHSARYVTKTHTANVSTFQTPSHGPVGLITKHRLLYFQKENDKDYFDIETATGNIPIIKAYAGMTGNFLSMIDLEKIDGLIIEALGEGNLPPEFANSLKRLLDAKIPIALVSRCFNGIVEPVYSYDGGGSQLYNMGILFSDEINSQKARIKLIVALNANLSDESRLRDYIEN